MNTIMIQADKLLDAAAGILKKIGIPEDQARVIASVLVQADLRGIGSHGVLRLPAYVHKVQHGLLETDTQLTVIEERKATVLLDAGGGFGPVAAAEAMRQAIGKAKELGLGSAAVRNASHFGIAAYYARLAVEEGLIGVVISNAAASMAPFGGVQPMLGTNPVCVGIPTGKEPAILLDMASSVVARGKIRLAQREGKSIPEGWALDASGVPTQNPDEAIAGTLLPIGGPKGYGIALVNDILSGILTGSPSSLEVRSVHDLKNPSPVGFFLQAIDISAFCDPVLFYERVDALSEQLRAADPADGVSRIYTPGEPEWEREQERRENGIPIGPKVMESLLDLAGELNVQINL